MVRFLTIREGIIYYTVEEMVELVEKGIRDLGELVLREAEGAGTSTVRSSQSRCRGAGRGSKCIPKLDGAGCRGATGCGELFGQDHLTAY